MNAFVDSLKADLLNKRVLPLLVVLGVALVGVLAYAVLGGSSEAPSTPAASAVTHGAPTAGLDVTQTTTSSDKAIAETTSGTPKLRLHANNPFKPLPAPKAAAASSSSKGSGSSSSGSGASSSGSSGGSPSSNSSPESPSSGSSTSSSSGSSGSGSSTPAPNTSKPAKPKPPAPVYQVDIQFGQVSTTPGQNTQLTPYDNLKPSAQVPSSSSPIVVYSGATDGGKRVTFKLAAEVILHGPAVCKPSTSQCESIVLKPGQTEELEYLPPSGGAAVLYKLELVSIAPVKASTATAHKASAAAAHKASAAKSHR